MGGQNVHAKRVNIVTEKILRAETSDLKMR